MAKVTVINRLANQRSVTDNLELALRESIRARSRAQLAELCADYFDAVDDFLFSGGSKGQFAEEGNYLKAMREMRTKQGLFEEAFLDITASTLFSAGACADKSATQNARHLVERHEEIYQMLEVDLALQAMQRKAEKCFAPFTQQIDALLSRLSTSEQRSSQHFALVAACMWAFGEAQRVFALPLDIRLVVIKLFEQHFLLKLEKQFLDVINIAKHALVKGAVDARFLAASQLRSRNPAHAPAEFGDPANTSSASAPAGSPAKSIELAVDAAIAGLCAQPNLPAFVIDMLRCKWRTVLFLIGMHRGCFGSEWRDSLAAMQALVASASGQLDLAAPAMDDMLAQLRSGFALLQMPDAEQAAFADQVRSWLQQQSYANSDAKPPGKAVDSPAYAAEASVSPSGKKILNRADLEEITSLLGTDDADFSKAAMERQLLDCLPEIDRLREEATIEYRIDGSFQACTLQKNPAKPGMFNITDRHSKTTITRSRLGLAISLHEGELRLPGSVHKTAVSQKTVIESASGKTIH